MKKTQGQKSDTSLNASSKTSTDDKNSNDIIMAFCCLFKNIRRLIAKRQKIITTLSAVLVLISIASIVIYLCVNFEPADKDLLTNVIIEVIGVTLTFILFDMYTNRLQESSQQMPGKYLHYARLFKYTKKFINEATLMKEQLIKGKLSRAETLSLQKVRDEFETAVYDATSYLAQTEFDLLWPLLWDEKLCIDTTITELHKFSQWLEHDIRTSVDYDDTEI